jgi:hypothetical protein
MDEELKGKIISEILENIPPNIKPVSYLQDILGIGREAAYRRMRGDISFTVEELAEMSIVLDFSTDELFGKNRKKRVFFNWEMDKHDCLSKSFTILLQQYHDLIVQKIKSKNALSLAAVNLIPSSFLVYFNNLFKYRYYRWMHQRSESSLSYSLSDVILPPDIIALQDKIKADFKQNNNNIFVIDPNMFANTINEIVYYYHRKLINREELQLLKSELVRLVDLLEKIIQTGVFDNSAHFYFYLSSVNIETNSSYIECGNHIISHFQIFVMNPVMIRNSEICRIHKKYLESMKKYSSLITCSNEMLQVSYIKRQRELINNIDSDIPCVLSCGMG